MVKVDKTKRAGELTEDECKRISNCIEDPLAHGIPTYIFNRQYDYKDGKDYHKVSNELDTKLREDLERMKKVR